MPIVELKELKKFPEVKGVFIGGCVERGDGSRFRALAHAHVTKDDVNYHWICVLSKKRPLIEKGKLSQTMLHEIAHILTDSGHTDKWRKQAVAIGYELPLHYEKRVKTVADVGRSVVKKGRKFLIYKDGRLSEIRFK